MQSSVVVGAMMVSDGRGQDARVELDLPQGCGQGVERMSTLRDYSADVSFSRSAKELWEGAVAYTRARSPSSFDQWFAGIQFDALRDGMLYLRARDEFVLEWVRDHFV